MEPQTLTDYERKRLENIRRNDEMVASLKLHLKANSLSSATKIKRFISLSSTPLSAIPFLLNKILICFQFPLFYIWVICGFVCLLFSFHLISPSLACLGFLSFSISMSGCSRFCFFLPFLYLGILGFASFCFFKTFYLGLLGFSFFSSVSLSGWLFFIFSVWVL